MVTLDAESPPTTMTEVFLRMFAEEARWLDGFISKKKEELGEAFPEFVPANNWEGEPVFNKRLAAYRRLQHAFWERAHTDPAASRATEGMQLLPSASDINLNSFHKELRKMLEAEQKREDVQPETEQRKAA